jgi:hypothetical protein
VATYTDAATIASYLGVTFSPAQVLQATAIAAAATAFIDNYTARSWQAPSPIAAELSPIVAKRVDGSEIVTPTIYLLHTPAVAVTGVVLRATAPNSQPQVLASTEYELMDAANGVLRLLLTALWQGHAIAASYPYADPVVGLVDYTWAAGPPPDIALAATMIGATEMARVLALAGSAGGIQAHPELAGIKSIAVGQNDIAVTLADPSSIDIGTAAGSSWAAAGSAVAAILNPYVYIAIA